MARVTVEDCLAHIPNRFDLTLIAARRARQVATGSSPRVLVDRDKPTVVALREIAAAKVGSEVLDDPIPVMQREPTPLPYQFDGE